MQNSTVCDRCHGYKKSFWPDLLYSDHYLLLSIFKNSNRHPLTNHITAFPLVTIYIYIYLFINKQERTTQILVVVDTLPCCSNIQRWYESSCFRHSFMVKMRDSHSRVLNTTAETTVWHCRLKEPLRGQRQERERDWDRESYNVSYYHTTYEIPIV